MNNMRFRVFALAAILMAVQLMWMTPARGEGEVILVSDDGHVALTAGDKGDTAKGSVTLTNNSNLPVPITVVRGTGSPTACEIARSPTALEPLRQQKVTLSFTNCAAEKAFKFKLTAGTAAIPQLTAEPPTKADPDWRLLWWFVWSALAGAVVIGATFAWWEHQKTAERGWRMDLPGLAATWSFKDSWASNATVIAAAFAGLFGATDVAETIFGDDAKNVVAIVGVATAGALGLAGIAPLVLQILRSKSGAVSPLAIATAGIVTIAATGGELAVTAWAVKNSSLGNDAFILGAGALGGLLLLLYAWRATLQNFRIGETSVVDVSKKPTLHPRVRRSIEPGRRRQLQGVIEDLETIQVEPEDLFEVEYQPEPMMMSGRPAAIL